jgi:hypothetical protein
MNAKESVEGSNQRLSKAADDSAALKQKFLVAVKKRSTNQINVNDNILFPTERNGPNELEHAKQRFPVTMSHSYRSTAEDEATGRIGSAETKESSFNLRRVLQSNKSISPATIERILAIESETRKELGNKISDSFQTPYSKQDLKNQVAFDDSKLRSFNFMEQNSSRRNDMYLVKYEVSQKEKAKEIIAKRRLSKQSHTISNPAGLYLQPSPMPDMKEIQWHGPMNHTQSYRSLPNQYVPQKHHLASLVKNQYLGASIPLPMKNVMDKTPIHNAYAYHHRPNFPSVMLPGNQGMVGTMANVYDKRGPSPQPVQYRRVQNIKRSPNQSPPKMMSFPNVMMKMNDAYTSFARPFISKPINAARRHPNDSLPRNKMNGQRGAPIQKSPVASNRKVAVKPKPSYSSSFSGSTSSGTTTSSSDS